MLTRENDIDIHALHRQGWTISAIARHLGRDRKTVRAYLAGREAGVRRRSDPDLFGPFAAYCRQRLADDPHLWASTLFDELLELGYGQSYPTMTRQIRVRGLRPACEPCRPAKGRAVAVIDHPPGQETQWDWVELPDPPPAWGWGKTAHLLVGALSHSGKWRGVLAESEDQPHLIDALDRVAHALGGLTLDWRFDRMATVVSPGTGRVTASFAAVAKHYGVSVKPCPPRRGNRKGVVEKANHVAAQRFWRTLPDDVTVEQAQARLDAWCTKRGDARRRATDEGRFTVAQLAAGEVLAPMPTQFPALLSVDRVVSAQALVSFRGNRYSVPPNLHGATVTVSVRLDGTHLDIATTPGTTSNGRGGVVPTVIARHRIAPTGAGVMVRDHGHVTALDQAAMGAATLEAPHRGKQRRPLTAAARAEADALRPRTGAGHSDTGVVVDLAHYAAAAAGRNTLGTTSPAAAPREETPVPSKDTTQPQPTIKEITQS
ncbi:MAG: IS21 family transposase [Actinomycetota bacterium]|nr:IS21 family transposase [Actinomycetota bacterium]